MLTTLNEKKIDRLAEMLNVLADPIRMRIVLNLTKPTSMSDLHQGLQIGQISLLHHLNQMENSGFLCKEYWNSEIYYSLKDVVLGRAVKLLLAK